MIPKVIMNMYETNEKIDISAKRVRCIALNADLTKRDISNQ